MPDASTINMGNERSLPVKKQKLKTSQKSSYGESLKRLIAGQTSLFRILGTAFIRKPARFIVVCLIIAFCGAIIINATTLQSERHPSPFFAVAPANTFAAIPLPPTRPVGLAGSGTTSSIRTVINDADIAKQSMLVKDLQGVLARRGFYAGPIDGQLSSRVEIAISEFEKAASLPVTGEPTEKLLTLVSSSKLTMKDQLLVLIKDSAPSSVADKSKTNLQVQRALNKIGYGPIIEDGIYGATTKSAIEHFEKKRKLAVRGEPNGRVLKELAAASGIVVE